MANYLISDNTTGNRKGTSDRVAQINHSIMALARMAELHRVQTKDNKSLRPTLTEEFFEGVRII